MARPDALYSERLTLRTPSIRDADQMYRLCCDPEILRRTGIPQNPYLRRHAMEFIKSVHRHHRKGNTWHWSIRKRETDDLMGMVTLYAQRRSNLVAEIGCWLGRPYWRQGHMGEAFGLVLNYGFGTLKLKRIYAGIFSHNAWSVGLVEKLGFVREGTLRCAAKVRGRWRDEHIYAMLREEWQSMNIRE